MEIKVTAEGLVLFVVAVAVILITVYLVKLLKSLTEILKNANDFFKENRKNLDETLNSVNAITTSAKNKVDYLDKFLKSNDEVAASNDFSNIVSIAQAAFDLYDQIKGIIPKKKRHRR